MMCRATKTVKNQKENCKFLEHAVKMFYRPQTFATEVTISNKGNFKNQKPLYQLYINQLYLAIER